MKPQKIRLSRERETLLVPLYSKALESRRAHPIIADPKACEILDRLDYDFGALRVPRQSLVTLAMRARKLDSCVEEYLRGAANPLVLHLGCGLDSRVLRVGSRRGRWYDLDYPEVIELRRRFYRETDHYHMIASSVTDHAWLAEVEGTGPACIIAEGLLMYLDEGEVRALFAALQARLPGSQIAFDAYSRLTAKRAGGHPSLRKTGAQIRWGIDDPRRMEPWGRGVRVLEEWCFTESQDIAALGLGLRLLFRIAGAFAAARRAHRIIRVQL